MGDLKTAKLPSFIEKEDSKWKERKEIQGEGKGRALNLSCCRMGLPHCAAATTLVRTSVLLTMRGQCTKAFDSKG